MKYERHHTKRHLPTDRLVHAERIIMAFDSLVQDNLRATIKRLGLNCSPDELVTALPVILVVEGTTARWAGQDALIQDFIKDACAGLPEDIIERVKAADRVVLRSNQNVFARLRFCAMLRLYGINASVKFTEAELWAQTFKVFYLQEDEALSTLDVKAPVLLLGDVFVTNAEVTVDGPYWFAVPEVSRVLIKSGLTVEQLLPQLLASGKKCIVYTASADVKDECDKASIACRVLTEDSAQRYVPVTSYDVVVFHTLNCPYKVQKLFERNLAEIVEQQQLVEGQ